MLSTFEKLLLLKKVPFFSDLDSDDLKRISDICDEVFFPAGNIIIKQGEEGRELFILEHGKAKVFFGSKTVDLMPPAHIGEMAILTGGKRGATIEAVEDTNTLSIDSEKFRALILEHPHIIFPIIRSILERLKPA